MFLTRMALDVNREDTMQLLSEPGRMQREVRAAFAGGNMQPLFRMEMIGSRLWLVVLSRLRPTLYAAHERYGYLGVFPSWETFDFDETLEQAENGTTWNFFLSASPQGVRPEADPVWLDPRRLSQWLTRQSEACGFEVRQCKVVRAEWRPAGDAFIQLVEFDGVLTVTDQDTFTWAVSTGIGNARENGAGLMTIAHNPTFWED
ncbi:MAG: type I-E CRISPR-associated protein Cas6/Cse3/CasE [Clostridia bacterium]|nr:type I-E CRISPR-associated protein Cas6/Cse3/CasE [Clostridia bacterium]MBR4459410.1 type I-E CRISPR-associated protein Cas6/Cse3/CasE [Clostridia bacterium]